DAHVAAIAPTQSLQFLHESRYDVLCIRISLRQIHEHAHAACILLLRARRERPRRRRAAEQSDELAPFHCSPPASVNGSNSLRLRVGLPGQKLPPLRSLGPDVEKFEPEAARLAVDLGLDRRPASDERGIADHAHLTVRKASALILGLARSHRYEPG